MGMNWAPQAAIRQSPAVHASSAKRANAPANAAQTCTGRRIIFDKNALALTLWFSSHPNPRNVYVLVGRY
jgi:hypothetical protein